MARKLKVYEQSMGGGYIPDGKGVYYEEKICETNAVCKNDDELTLCLIKQL